MDISWNMIWQMYGARPHVRDESHDGHGNHPQMAINSFWENPRGGSESGLNVYVKVLKNGLKNVGQ